MHNKKPAMTGFEQTDFLLPYVGINRIKFKGSDPSSQSFDSPSMSLLYHMASTRRHEKNKGAFLLSTERKELDEALRNTEI